MAQQSCDSFSVWVQCWKECTENTLSFITSVILQSFSPWYLQRNFTSRKEWLTSNVIYVKKVIKIKNKSTFWHIFEQKQMTLSLCHCNESWGSRKIALTSASFRKLTNNVKWVPWTHNEFRRWYGFLYIYRSWCLSFWKQITTSPKWIVWIFLLAYSSFLSVQVIT